MAAIKIRTDQAESGMVVADDVITSSNQLIIPKGTILDERMITRLRFYGIYGISIVENGVEVKKEENSYINTLRNSEEFKKFNSTYVETINNVQNNLSDVLNDNSDFDIDKLIADTERIMREGRNGAHILEMLHGIRNYDDLTYVHSLNVSLICSIFAGWLKMTPEETKVLALGGLLHDVDKMLIPKEIVAKPAKLTEDEYNIMKTHTIAGYQALKNKPIDIRIKYATLMHHERCDGSGYPNGFKAGQIDSFSKIIAIADVYDAMTSSRRYRTAICPFSVIETFEKDGFQKFDPGYLMIFMERVVNTYLHNYVRLNDGREGEVVMINKFNVSKPVVRIGTEFVDLSKESDLSIIAII